jgi:hypothetical protein
MASARRHIECITRTIRTALGSPGRVAHLVRFQSVSIAVRKTRVRVLYACVCVPLRVYIVYLCISRTVQALELCRPTPGYFSFGEFSGYIYKCQPPGGPCQRAPF